MSGGGGIKVKTRSSLKKSENTRETLFWCLVGLHRCLVGHFNWCDKNDSKRLVSTNHHLCSELFSD